MIALWLIMVSWLFIPIPSSHASHSPASRDPVIKEIVVRVKGDHVALRDPARPLDVLMQADKDEMFPYVASLKSLQNREGSHYVIELDRTYLAISAAHAQLETIFYETPVTAQEELEDTSTGIFTDASLYGGPGQQAATQQTSLVTQQGKSRGITSKVVTLILGVAVIIGALSLLNRYVKIV